MSQVSCSCLHVRLFACPSPHPRWTWIDALVRCCALRPGRAGPFFGRPILLLVFVCVDIPWLCASFESPVSNACGWNSRIHRLEGLSAYCWPCRVSEKVVDGFGWNVVDTLGVWRRRIDSILLKIRIRIQIRGLFNFLSDSSPLKDGAKNDGYPDISKMYWAWYVLVD